MAAKNNRKTPEVNQIYLPLNFDPTLAGIESEKEDGEVQIAPLTSALKKKLWPIDEDNVEWSGKEIYSKFLNASRKLLNLCRSKR